MDVDFDFTVTRLAKIANTNNLSVYGELWSSQIGAPHVKVNLAPRIDR
jgi:hypothetical protein